MMPVIKVNGIRLNLRLEGEGPPVLLVHGFPDSHAVWRRQIPALVAAGFQVIAPDTRGCGDSEISPDVADYRLENLVADLVGLLDHLGVDKVRLVAHDWGAVIAWHLVLAHPERVERYIPLSVGHPACYAHGGLMQKLKGYYALLIQLRGIAERLCRPAVDRIPRGVFAMAVLPGPPGSPDRRHELLPGQFFQAVVFAGPAPRQGAGLCLVE